MSFFDENSNHVQLAIGYKGFSYYAATSSQIRVRRRGGVPELYQGLSKINLVERQVNLGCQINLRPQIKLERRLRMIMRTSLKCLFFGKSKCSIIRWPHQTERLKNMRDAVTLPGISLPDGFTERDLIHDRLRCDEPDAPISYLTELCPQHRYRYGIGWQTGKKRENKGRPAAICEWKKHGAVAKAYLSYEDTWEIEERTGRRVPIGLPVCRNCLPLAKEGFTGSKERSQEHFENSKVILDEKLQSPPPPLQPSPEVTGRRLTSIQAGGMRLQKNFHLPKDSCEKTSRMPKQKDVNSVHYDSICTYC